MQMQPPLGLSHQCAASDIPPQQIRILSGAWVLFSSSFPNLSPDYLQTAPLQGATRDPAESSGLRALSKTEVEPVSSHHHPPPPSPSPITVYAKLHRRFSPKLRTDFLRVGLTSFRWEKRVCKLEAGPELAKMGTEGGVTPVVQHSSALGLDSLDNAQRGCGRGCSQPARHPHPVGGCWPGKGSGHFERECQRASKTQQETLGSGLPRRMMPWLLALPAFEPHPLCPELLASQAVFREGGPERLTKPSGE